MSTSFSTSFASVMIVLVISTGFHSQSLWCVLVVGSYSPISHTGCLAGDEGRQREEKVVCYDSTWQFVLHTEAPRDILKEKSSVCVHKSAEMLKLQADGQVITQEESRRKESRGEEKEKL